AKVQTKVADFWVTDGTPAGTTEIAGSGSLEFIDGISGAAFGSEFLFGGTIQSHLWVANGTSASELSVAGSPLNPRFFAALGSEVLFNGSANGSPGLWVSDGTSAGKSELKVTGDAQANTAANGIAPSRL